MDENEKVLKCFGRNDCLGDLCDELKEKFPASKVEAESKAVLCFLFGQLHNVYQSITVLCREGYPYQGYVLLRSLLEGYVYVSYILDEEKVDTVAARAREWIEYDIVERKRLLDTVEKTEELPPGFKDRWSKQREEILRVYKEVKKKGGLWPDKSMETLCNEAQLEGEYLLYRDFSSKGHLSVRSSRDHVRIDVDGIKHRWGPSRGVGEVGPVLGLAHRYFLLVLLRLSWFFGVELSDELLWHANLRGDLPDSVMKRLKSSGQ